MSTAVAIGNAHADPVGKHPGDVTETATSQAITWTGNDVIRTTTVRDLEQAMKRHLPSAFSGHDERAAGGRHRRRSAAHWTPYHVTSPLLPASDLLRTLHDAAVRRQQRSVICTSVPVDRHY